MYQGICIANCESNATYPQRNLYRTLYQSEMSLQVDTITNVNMKKDRTSLVYLTFLITNMKKFRNKLICVIKLI